ETPALLASRGVTYLLDWCCDDQPFQFSQHGLTSVPYSLEINDLSMWLRSFLTGQLYEAVVRDQFEILMEQAQHTSVVMALPLHTFVVGQPHLFKHLRSVLREICAHDDVWLTTSDDIAAHFRAR